MRLIAALYAAPEAQLCINKLHSQPIALRRGTRQGCPLSPILSPLLAIAIRENEAIMGIPVGQLSSKISLFVDDLLVTLTNPKTSLEALVSTLQEFGKISGLLVNYSKTYILSNQYSQRYANRAEEL